MAVEGKRVLLPQLVAQEGLVGEPVLQGLVILVPQAVEWVMLVRLPQQDGLPELGLVRVVGLGPKHQASTQEGQKQEEEREEERKE
jgi:hypothetical protein